MTSQNTSFPDLSWSVTQELIDTYADVSGDRNPLHIDPEFAKQTRFGGTISHGFLTLAWLSQWASEYFGARWLDDGQLEVNFIGAVHPGDTVSVAAEPLDNGPAVRISCRVGDRDVIVGTVSVGSA